ncbi:lantibiotic dehydratase [Tenacibaculum sp. MEBiC06402]|uniref:lantibiotic dehydratase n=1 Tax=unclassified Tenacibaculum TaxID=2635139 RepID=UPI003B993ADD
MENFNHINRFILRAPIQTVNHFSEIPSERNQVVSFVKELFYDEVFKESIFLASPDLYYEWSRMVTDADMSETKQDKIITSIAKYYIRSTTRCTPFGLFSGYTEIKHKEETPHKNYKTLERFSGIDLEFFYTLIYKFNKNKEIRNCAKFSINSSMYKVGSHYRYAEFQITNNKRAYSLIEVEADEVLELIVNVVRKDVQTLKELTELLLYAIEEISEEEVLAYLHSLIDSQILVSDLDITINGISPLHQIVSYFESNIIKVTNDIDVLSYHKLLVQLKDKLSEIDANVTGNSISEYNEIFKIADAFEIRFDKKYLINTNLRNNLPEKEYDLSSAQISSIKKAIYALSRFSLKNDNSNLNNFKTAFYKRFEDKEIPLLIALDNELGVGYIQDHSDASNFSSLIDDIKINNEEPTESKIKYHHKIHKFWTDQFLKAQKNKQQTIDLEKIDLNDFPTNISLLSQSFYTMINKFQENISIEVVGGTGALNLIGRFSSLDSSLNELFQDADGQETNDENEILVELLHVPDNRSGNILLRNVPRTHEIAFLTKGNDSKQQISLDDIFVSIKHNRIVLRSKKLNKQLKIVNTTAHNFQYNALPVYQFLSELQMQDCTSALGLNIGSVNYKVFKTRPRITHGDIILSPAKWYFSKEELTAFFHHNKCEIETLRAFLYKHNVPRYVCIREQQDHTLWIDLENDFMYSYIAESVKKNKYLSLEEILVDNIESQKKVFNTEYIIPFFKEAKKAKLFSFNEVTEKRTFIPGDDWIYFKIYTGTKSSNSILLNAMMQLIEKMKAKGLIKKWHFVRFRDPDFHIRLRFLLSDNSFYNQVVKYVNEVLHPYVENHAVWKVELSTYNRELERYGNSLIVPSESMFHRDSELILQMQHLLKGVSNEFSWIPMLRTIDNVYELFGFTLQEKLNHINNLYEAFLQEFNGDKHLKKQIEAKFRAHKDSISELFQNQSTELYNLVINHNQNFYKDLGASKSVLIPEMKANISSYIHMHVNRFSITNPRMHELVLYGVLSKYYKMMLGRMKFVKQNHATL